MDAKKHQSFIENRQSSFASDIEQRRKSPVTKNFLDSSPKAIGSKYKNVMKTEETKQAVNPNLANEAEQNQINLSFKNLVTLEQLPKLLQKDLATQIPNHIILQSI